MIDNITAIIIAATIGTVLGRILADFVPLAPPRRRRRARRAAAASVRRRLQVHG